MVINTIDDDQRSLLNILAYCDDLYERIFPGGVQCAYRYALPIFMPLAALIALVALIFVPIALLVGHAIVLR